MLRVVKDTKSPQDELRRQSDLKISGRHLHVVFPGNTDKVLRRSAFLPSWEDSVIRIFPIPYDGSFGSGKVGFY